MIRLDKNTIKYYIVILLTISVVIAYLMQNNAVSNTTTCVEIATVSETEITVVETTETETTTTEPVETEPAINQDELYLLAHLINGEAGSSWHSDELQIYVGSVVLNRMASSHFPDTMHGVIYQSGQYACTWDGNFDKEPTERAWRNAEYVLTNGSQLPANVVFQAQFRQGSGVYCQIGNTYFCYL